jgi:hypothetical protein
MLLLLLLLLSLAVQAIKRMAAVNKVDLPL